MSDIKWEAIEEAGPDRSLVIRDHRSCRTICRMVTAREEDARMVAAAPEMYEFIERCAEGEHYDEIPEEAQELLAKIKGDE